VRVTILKHEKRHPRFGMNRWCHASTRPAF
jgi:hypothetical protein